MIFQRSGRGDSSHGSLQLVGDDGGDTEEGQEASGRLEL